MLPALLGASSALIVGLGAGAMLLAPGAERPADTSHPSTGAAAQAGPATGAAVAVKATATAQRSPTRPVAPDSAQTKTIKMEDQVTALVNKERNAAGCRPVRTDERMRTAARAHSTDMARNNYFSHTGLDGSTFVDRLVAAQYPRSKASGENIAFGHADAAAVMKSWMNSPGHKRNILDCKARTTGLGLVYRGRTPYWTQEFGTAS